MSPSLTLRLTAALPTLILVAFLSRGSPAAALDPSRSLSQYVYARWGPDNGLLGGAVYAISTSPDGYLWIGTDRGLVRFDGYSFELLQQPVAALPPIGRVRGLLADAHGDLWIRPEGDRLLLYRNGRFTDAFTAFQMGDSTITAMALDREGRALLSGITTPVLRSSDGKLDRIADVTRVAGTVAAIAESRDGRVWLGSPQTGLFVVGRDGIPQPSAPLGNLRINALAPARNGGLWIGSDRGCGC